MKLDINNRKFAFWGSVFLVVLVFFLLNFLGRGHMDSAIEAMRSMVFRSEAVTATQAVAWDANPEPDILSYVLKWGNSPGSHPSFQDVGNVTESSINYQLDGLPRYAVVTAKNTAGAESGPSNEIVFGSTPIPSTPSPTPTATATVPVATPTATATATPMATATVPPPTPVPTATVTPTATATATPTATAIPTPSPSPNFTLTINPTSRTVPATGGLTKFIVQIIPTSGFNSPVSLTVNGLPAGIERKFNNDPTDTRRTLILTIDAGTSPATYPFTVTGQSYNPVLTRTISGTLVKQ